MDGLGLSKIQVVYDDEVAKFYENGFKGNIYKKYANILPISTFSSSTSNKNTYAVTSNLANFYLKV